MKRLLLLMLLSFVGTCVAAAEDCFDRVAREKGLDADLLRAIAFVESSGNPSAVGRNASSEDYGLMQINSGWLKRFKTSKSELLNDACFNVQVKVGDYVAFEPKASAVGGYRLTFIKEVVCGPGQTLTRENRTFYCDGKELTTAKERALNGTPLKATVPQVLGEDQYFVRGTHKDSYDSRYEAFGLIDRCRFSGRAYPLF